MLNLCLQKYFEFFGVQLLLNVTHLHYPFCSDNSNLWVIQYFPSFTQLIDKRVQMSPNVWKFNSFLHNYWKRAKKTGIWFCSIPNKSFEVVKLFVFQLLLYLYWILFVFFVFFNRSNTINLSLHFFKFFLSFH